MKRLAIYIVLNCFAVLLCAQLNETLDFKQYSLKEGLSQSTVYAIVQDASGYLWVATDDGLNRFDGGTFTVFRHVRSDSASLVSSFTRSLFIDSCNRLWVGTQNGLSCYDHLHKCFRNFPSATDLNQEKLTIFRMDEYKGALLLATNQGLYRFTEKDGYKPLIYNSMRAMSVKRFRHHILLGTDEGLFFVFPETNSCELVHEQFRNTVVLAMEPHATDSNKIWVGTEGKGLFLYDVAHRTVVSYKHDKTQSASLSSDYVRSLCYDSHKRLWVGTFVGLNISAVDGVFERHFYSPQKTGEISQNSIRAIFRDNQGGMWCGTYFGGLNYYHPLRERFQHIKNQFFVNSINDNVISVMLSDDSNNLWIGTNDNGLNYYNDAQKQYSFFTKKEGNSTTLPSNNVKALLRAHNGLLYVGTHGGGLSLFSSATKQFKRLPFSNPNVYSIIYGQDGHLWIGTLNGLYVYDEKLNRVVPLNGQMVTLPDYQILCLFSDSKGMTWVGTDRGAYLYNAYTQQFIQVEPSAENYRRVHCFVEDKKGQVWLGTREGLLYYDRQRSLLVNMQEQIGFPEMVIYGILEDNFSQLWLSTNNGLICLNLLTNQWRVYTEKDGLQSNQFNVYAYCKNSRGKLYFGGINGITAFYPERLVDNPFAPPALIDRVTVLGREVLANDGSGIFESKGNTAGKLRLHYDQTVFSIDLSVPNFLSGGKNTYAYRFEGVDDDWIYTSDRHITFSHLPIDKYVLEVRAANNDGKWSDSITRLQIEILPPWWRTWWAFLLFACVLIVFTWLSISIYTTRKLMERRIEMERQEKERNHDLNEAKVRFFINIAHEFKTPLTLMMSPLQEIIQQGVPNRWMREQLAYIMRNCKRMLGLINQTLDYRRSEMGVLELHVAKQPLDGFVSEIVDIFRKLADKHNINYNYVGLADSTTQVFYDANYVERILSNLISNAFKYTPQGGTIEVVLELCQKSLILQVHDTGCGIAPENLEHIFDRFYQVEENTNGTGIGLSFVKSLVNHYRGEITVKSQLGEGSVFTVHLPCNEEDFLPTELDTENKQYETILDRVYTENDISILPENTMDDISEKPESASKKRIMLVEDDDEVRTYLIDNFKDKYEITAFENGKQAWDKLNEQPEVDLIISDVMMPEMDGTQLCKLVKQNIRFCHIPFFLLTAKSDMGDEISALALGADDYISKPFVFSVLRTKVTNLFKSQQRILQHYATVNTNNMAELAGNPLDEEFLTKAIGIIEKNMDNPEFSTEDFSSAMNMSRSNLYLKLKALTGESAVEFIRRIRFSYACKLLKEGRYNVSEISTMIGFTPSYFATSFKKYMGCMPSEYLKRK